MKGFYVVSARFCSYWLLNLYCQLRRDVTDIIMVSYWNWYNSIKRQLQLVGRLKNVSLSSSCYNKNTIHWVTETTLTSHSFGGWNIQKDGAGRLGVWWGPDSSLTAALSLCPNVAEGLGSSGGPLVERHKFHFMLITWSPPKGPTSQDHHIGS